MLQIQMHKGEFITVGGNVKIYCTKTTPSGAVTLGIDAPPDVRVLRTKHLEAELKLLANAGDREAQDSLEKLNAAREEREASRKERQIIATKRKEKQKAV